MQINRDIKNGLTFLWVLLFMIAMLGMCTMIKAQEPFIIEFENDTICPHRPFDPITIKDRVYWSKQQYDSCKTKYLLYSDKLVLIQPNCRKRKYTCIICGKKIIKNKPDTIIINKNENYIKAFKLIKK